MNGSEEWTTEFTLRMATAAQLAEWGDFEAALALLRCGRDNVTRELTQPDSLRESLITQYDELIHRFVLRMGLRPSVTTELPLR